MFTGIIEEIGQIVRLAPMDGGIRFTIAAEEVLSDLAVGDSISVDGVCLTVVEVTKETFTVEAVGETLEKTALGSYQQGDWVNLERPLKVEARLGGHFVQGHVNATGKILKWMKRGENYLLEVEIPAHLMKYIILEGSIAINGISLTVATLKNNVVGINIIPHTARVTSLQFKKPEDPVNIEVDLIAKYIENLLPEKFKSGEVYHESSSH